jgi:Sec-independent protein translocase protein TatA
MFDVSWGELAVVTGLGLFLVGKKDLPAATRVVGRHFGRAVGVLQGARARADRFAANHELRQLQNELRAGLRELDAVKSEFAVSMSPSRSLGATVPGVNRMAVAENRSLGATPVPSIHRTAVAENQVFSGTPAAVPSGVPTAADLHELPPERQTIAAVAEEEWKRRGIDFTSRAEQGSGVRMDVTKSGSAVLAGILRRVSSSRNTTG